MIVMINFAGRVIEREDCFFPFSDHSLSDQFLFVTLNFPLAAFHAIN